MTLCCPSKIFGLTIAPREIENNAHAKFWRDNKEDNGILKKGLYMRCTVNCVTSELYFLS